MDAFTALSRDVGTFLSPVALPETIRTDDCFSMSVLVLKSEKWREDAWDPFVFITRKIQTFLSRNFSLMRSVFSLCDHLTFWLLVLIRFVASIRPCFPLTEQVVWSQCLSMCSMALSTSKFSVSIKSSSV